LALELAPVRVNVVSPGIIDTPIRAAMPEAARNETRRGDGRPAIQRDQAGRFAIRGADAISVRAEFKDCKGHRADHPAVRTRARR